MMAARPVQIDLFEAVRLPAAEPRVYGAPRSWWRAYCRQVQRGRMAYSATDWHAYRMSRSVRLRLQAQQQARTAEARLGTPDVVVVYQADRVSPIMARMVREGRFPAWRWDPSLGVVRDVRHTVVAA